MSNNKKTAEAILIDFLYSHDIMDIEKGRAGNTPRHRADPPRTTYILGC